MTLLLALACTRSSSTGTVISFPASAVGAEATVLRRQIARFEASHPGVTVAQRPTPDAADQRHQLYVQWLNARAPEPDILQLDVIWTPEFAAAGWILPLDRFRPPVDSFFPPPSGRTPGTAGSTPCPGSWTWGCSTGAPTC
jgi:multiple sugar transport system substrate-binding protein